MRSSKDVTGMKFGLLTAIKRTEQKKNGSYLWECKCDCGNECLVMLTRLTSGTTTSCGCRKNAYREKARVLYKRRRDHE